MVRVWRRRSAFLSLVAAEEALTLPENDREDDQPHLVDQIVLDQRAPELVAGIDDDLPVQTLLQVSHPIHDVALQDGGVAPVGFDEGRRDDVLGQVVQPVRPLAVPR